MIHSCRRWQLSLLTLPQIVLMMTPLLHMNILRLIFVGVRVMMLHYCQAIVNGSEQMSATLVGQVDWTCGTVHTLQALQK